LGEGTITYSLTADFLAVDFRPVGGFDTGADASTSSMLRVVIGTCFSSLGVLRGDLGVSFSCSINSSVISGTGCNFIALFLVEGFFSVTYFLTDSFFTLCLGVLTSSFLVEALVADFLAEGLRAIALGGSSSTWTSCLSSSSFSWESSGIFSE
jgi:hypothetical protein